MQAQAAFLVKNGDAFSAFEWRDIPVPQAKAGEVLVEIEAFGLNFADVLARNGLYREAPPLPAVLGYDMVGRVIGLGDGVDASLLGQRVVALTRFGAYASHIATPAVGCIPVPDNMAAGEACALGTQFTTAYYSAYYLQNIAEGSHVLVHAAMGGVGTALIQLLLLKNCTVYATVGSDEKVNALRKEGIHAFNYNSQDYSAEIKSLLGKKYLDVSFNSIAGTTFKKDMQLLGADGRLVLYGFAERSGKRGGKWATLRLLWNMGIVLPIMTLATSKSILGVNMLKIADQKPQIIQHCIQQLVQLWSEKKIKPVVGGVYSKEKLGQAHYDLEHRKIRGKSIVLLRDGHL
ncbi:MAG: quinone oxidoreductase family protein [Flavobacteriales bacterium]